MDLDKFANRGLQVLDAAEHPTPNPFVGEFGEPALD
jgi:hypothetical protein